MFRAMGVFAAACAALALVLTQPAAAECTRLGFSVNDFGKDVPTRDSRRLLQAYIKSWTAEKGIKTYTVGKTDTSCKLYLKLPLLGEEYTCRSTASVCW